ncbi:MAG TPA: hypothetical protein VFT64_08400 [Rickettsiales bacterium]|nr:hypothetical protein [Rickettsiales bacterium]
MLKSLKENPTIAFGIALPLLVVIILSIAAMVPNLLEAPPKYAVLYATDYYPGKDRGVIVNVENRKAKASYIPSCYGDLTKIYLFNPATGNAHELKTNTPQPPRGVQTADCNKPQSPVDISIPELENLDVDASDISPDGYAFQSGQYGSSGGVMTEIFFTRSYYSEPVLRKGSRTVRLPQTTGSYGAVKLIGWVIPISSAVSHAE